MAITIVDKQSSQVLFGFPFLIGVAAVCVDVPSEVNGLAELRFSPFFPENMVTEMMHRDIQNRIPPLSGIVQILSEFLCSQQEEMEPGHRFHIIGVNVEIARNPRRRIRVVVQWKIVHA